MKRYRLPIALSLAIHAALAGLFALGAFSIYRMEEGGGGPGGVVSVWIADGDGPSIGLERTVKRHPPSRRSEEMTTRTPRREINGAAASGGSEEKGFGGGTGDGAGGGTGSGVGSGLGGDPALAQIWKKINRSKYYPENAKARRIEGSPRVTFTIAEDGSVQGVAIAASCGEEILDDAARETIRRAAPLPFYPRPITLTVKYSLAD